MFRAMILAWLAGTLVPMVASANDTEQTVARPALEATAKALVDICGTHEHVVKFAREAGRLISTQEGAYFVVKQRLVRVNKHYLALFDDLARMMPPENDTAAEALWRFDTLGELLQESSENLDRLAREMKTATRICSQDLAAYETEFGEACPADAKVGCAENIFVRYCSNARKHNRIFKIGEETQTVYLKWPRFFDHHWAGPAKVGEAGEGWREDWTYGSDEEVWQNLGAQTAQDENRLETLAWTEEAYSAYTMIDTKPLMSRMIYNVMHATMHGGGEQSLAAAVDAVTARVKKVMRCELNPSLAREPTAGEAPTADAEAPSRPVEPSAETQAE